MLWRAWLILPSLLFVLFSGTRTAWADPVSASSSPVLRIASGELFFLLNTDDPFGQGTVFGSGFKLDLEVQFPSTVFKGPPFGTLQVGNQVFPMDVDHPAVISWLIITAEPPFGVPPTIPPGVDSFEKQYPFDFLGTLSVSTSGNHVTAFDLVGKGVATTSIFDAAAGTGEPPEFKVGDSRLNFSSPSPVPEPGTMLLVATGGMIVASRRRRRKAT